MLENGREHQRAQAQVAGAEQGPLVLTTVVPPQVAMARRAIIGLVGPDTDTENLPIAEEVGTDRRLSSIPGWTHVVWTQVGKLVAESGWTLLTGGRSRGVMDAACKVARQGEVCLWAHWHPWAHRRHPCSTT